MHSIIMFALQGVTVAIPDPTVNPTDFAQQLTQLWHTAWPVALMLGLYGLLEVLLKIPHTSPFLHWLDNGRVTMAIAGAIAFLGAALNIALDGGQLLQAFIAGIGALLFFSHPQAIPVATQKLMAAPLPTARVVSKESGRVRLTLLLALALTAMIAACSWWQKSGSGEAKKIGIDCLDKDLSSVKNIAIGLAPGLLGGDVQWQNVEAAAISAGEKFGGCLLVDVGDEVLKLTDRKLVARAHACVSSTEVPPLSCSHDAIVTYNGCTWACQSPTVLGKIDSTLNDFRTKLKTDARYIGERGAR